MTCANHVYLTVNSYVEALASASRFNTFEASCQVVACPAKQNFATIRTLHVQNLAEGYRKHCSLMADRQHLVRPSSIPWVYRPNRVQTPHAILISRGLPAAPRPRHLISCPLREVSFSILSGRKTESI